MMRTDECGLDVGGFVFTNIPIRKKADLLCVTRKKVAFFPLDRWFRAKKAPDFKKSYKNTTHL